MYNIHKMVQGWAGMDMIMTKDPQVLEDILRSFLKRRERVLLCFPEGKEHGLPEFVERCGAVPVPWGRDTRWKTLLQTGFAQRCGTVIGPASIVLGLSKLAKRMGTPLHIRNAILVGRQPDAWMVETIQTGLDCTVRCVWGQEKAEESGAVEQLRRELRRWTTILDFRLERGTGGLALEMVVFPGEKLPRLPTLGKLVIREWDPDQDAPFAVESL